MSIFVNTSGCPCLGFRGVLWWSYVTLSSIRLYANELERGIYGLASSPKLKPETIV